MGNLATVGAHTVVPPAMLKQSLSLDDLRVNTPPISGIGAGVTAPLSSVAETGDVYFFFTLNC